MTARAPQVRQLSELAGRAAPLLAHAGATPADAELAAAQRLRQDWDADLVAAAFGQSELRERATVKWSGAARMWFTRDGLEQASGEAVATHRARLLARRLAPDAMVADLGCGIGGDTRAVAASLPHGSVLAFDRSEVHAWCCRANVVAQPGDAMVSVAVADVRDLRLDRLRRKAGATALLLDPARRSGSRRTSARDTQPPLPWATSLAQYVPAVVVKAAPGLPHDAAPPGWTLEFVALGSRLKEAVLWSPATGRGGARSGMRLATVLSGPAHLAPTASTTHTLPADPATPAAPTRAPGNWLLDPSPAVTRAGAVADLAAAHGCWQIDPAIAFLCHDDPVDTPFARTYAVAASLPFRERQLREVLRGLDVGAVDIRRRGLAGDVERLRRSLRLTGRRRALLAMTRSKGRPWALVGFPR